MKRLFFISVLLVLSIVVSAQQDFRCTFSVTSNTSDGSTDRTRFQEMQKQIQEFINGQKWCNYNISQEERIECTMQLMINNIVSAEQYEGKLNVGLRRPVFNSTYNTTLFSYVDQNIEFTFVETDPLIFNENSFDNNLTSVIAFYMYIMLGIDFDSFSPGAGTQYYEKAQSVVNAAQSANEKGWRSIQGTRNRYWLIENLLNSSYYGAREFYYIYHRNGLDVMADNIAMGTSAATQAIEKLRNVNRQKPNLYIVYLILEAKRDEFINLYSGANDAEKNKFLQVMQEIDPTNMTRYNQVKNTN
ncbi:DUF4835 family protein [Odoribacter sp. OttesenSCG-928-L07]|nr:DUF4835 family protein [Odoribacter sp. OttesenSCG-928-L07]MDL2239945.1 DUF4835 family protein [Bacteroidales bacterium OttesenSCG-928-L14]